MYAPASPSDIVQGSGGICDVSGYTITTCSYEVPVGIRITPLLDDGSGPIPGQAGVRYCECAGAHDTPEARRLHCGAGHAANCAVDGTRYGPSDPQWQLLSAAQTSMSYDEEGIAPSVVIPWDFYADLEQLSGVPLSFPLDVAHDGTIVGVPDVDGILWSHTPVFADRTSAISPISASALPSKSRAPMRSATCVSG